MYFLPYFSQFLPVYFISSYFFILSLVPIICIFTFSQVVKVEFSRISIAGILIDVGGMQYPRLKPDRKRKSQTARESHIPLHYSCK